MKKLLFFILLFGCVSVNAQWITPIRVQDSTTAIGFYRDAGALILDESNLNYWKLTAPLLKTGTLATASKIKYTGLAGSVGVTGITGLTGVTGVTGATGQTGATLVPTMLQLTGDVNTSSTSLGNVTGLHTFSLEASSTYFFYFHAITTANATSVGMELTVNASAAVSRINFNYCYVLNGGAPGCQNNLTALQAGITTVTSQGATPTAFIVSGTVVTSGAVTFALQHASETATQTTIKAGSYGYIIKL